MLRGLGEVSVDRLFAQRLARFEAMQPVDEDQTITLAPNQDGCLLSDFKNTLCDLLDGLWLQRCTALYRVRRCPRSQIFLASSWYVSEGAKENILSPGRGSVLPEILNRSGDRIFVFEPLIVSVLR
jgi:hypothetical protein